MRANSYEWECALIKETSQSSLTPSAVWGHSEKMAVSTNQKGSLTEQHVCGDVNLQVA